MSKFLVFIFLLGAMVNAQEIPASSSRTIEPVPSGSNTSGSMLFPNTTEKKKYIRPVETPTIDMTQSTDLVDPGVKFQNQKFKSDAPPINFINDTFLGELSTKKDTLQMTLWDPRLEDGDRVRIWLNDEIIISDMTLTNAAQGFQIKLHEGINKIEVEALNQGYSAPNTSGIIVRDEDGEVMDEKICMINAGVKSMLIVLKE